MIKRLDKIIKHFLPVLYFLIAISFYLRTYDSCQIKITLIHIGGTILLTLWLIKLLEEWNTEFFKENLVIIVPVLLILLSNVVSHLRSPLKYASEMELIRKVMYFGIALLVMKEINSEEKIKLIMKWLLFATFVSTFYGIVQILDTRFFPGGMGERGLDPFIWRGAFGNRIFSTFGNPNFYGDFLVIMGPIVLALFIKTRQFFLAVLYLMVVVNVIFTYSKGAWLGFAFGFVSFAILFTLFFSHMQKGWAKKIMGGIVLVVVVVCILGVSFGIRKRLDSVKFRVYTWLSCWEMINVNPVLGTGIGTFYVTYPSWRRPQIFFIEAKHNTESDHPENEYLEVWYDEGIVGFGLFMWLIVFCVSMGWYGLKTFSQAVIPRAGPKGKIKQLAEDPRAFYMLGFLSGLIGLLVQNFMCVSLRFVSSGVMLWLVVGLIATLTINNPLPQQSGMFYKNSVKNPIPVFVRRIIFICLIVVAFFLISKFRGFFIGDVHHNIAIFHSKRGEWSQALQNYNKVTEKNYGFIMTHYFMGNVFNDRMHLIREYHPEWGDKETDELWTGIDMGKKGRVDPERSIGQYRDVWTLAPNYVQSHHQAGLVHLKLGEYFKSRNEMDKAMENFRKAIYQFEQYHLIDPIFAFNYYRLAYVYLQIGDAKSAEETYWRHLFTKETLFRPGTDEKEWVSQQLGRPAESVPEGCEIHKGIYHSFYPEDWGSRRFHEYSETHMNLGNLSYLSNDMKKAEGHYLKAVEYKPDNASAMKNLIIIYNGQKRQDDALRLWYRMREVAPNDPDVQKMFSRPPATG
ncbi:MAG: O-antigen ligase family protein [Elusimicrobiota bacterium]